MSPERTEDPSAEVPQIPTPDQPDPDPTPPPEDTDVEVDLDDQAARDAERDRELREKYGDQEY